MTHDDRALADRDCRRLADLHRATMPTSVLGRLGPALLGRYYRWVAASRLERLFLIREGGTIDGAAVVSDAPGTVLKRFAASETPAVAVAVLKGIATNGVFRRELAAYLRETATPRHDAPDSPELTQIFVAPDRQDRALGTALLGLVEADLRQRRVARYSARTVVEENERTLAFYERRGFRRVGEERFCGQMYARLKKSVPGVEG